MGILQSIKKAVIASSMEKQKKAKPFDVEYSERFTLPPDADGWRINSHYYSVHSLDTPECFFLRLARRGAGADDELWFLYRDIEGQIWMTPKNLVPKTGTMPAGVSCVKAGSEMALSYKGLLKKAKKGPLGCEPDPDDPGVEADIEALFTGSSGLFEFSRHMSTEPVARALAREKLNRDFQKSLAENHQVHYEQSGFVSGKISIGGKSRDFSRLPALRDHSYGKRDWSYMDRHIWMSALLENGDYVHTSLTRYPAITELQAGFYISGGKTVCLSRAAAMDSLPIGGKNESGPVAWGALPETLSYDVEYEDGKIRHFETRLDFGAAFKFKGYTLHEGVAAYTIDGVKGRGITEFGFNNDIRRWKH